VSKLSLAEAVSLLKATRSASVNLTDWDGEQTLTGDIYFEGDQVIFTNLKKIARMRHIAPTPTVRSTRKFTIPQNAEVVTLAKVIAISFTTPEHGDVIITFVPESSFATV